MTTFFKQKESIKTSKETVEQVIKKEKKTVETVKDEKPWFGIEQEYSLLEQKSKFALKPLGWPSSGYPGP